MEEQYRRNLEMGRGASYYSRSAINYSNINIDLNRTAYQIHNQIRVFIFPEYQLPKIAGREIISSTITTKRSSQKPGEIVTSFGNNVYFATIDYDICVRFKI